MPTNHGTMLQVNSHRLMSMAGYPCIRVHLGWRPRGGCRRTIQDLLAQGHSLNAIGRHLDLCFRTVQRYAQATSLDELLANASRDSGLDAFKPHLHQRFNDGCTDAVRLHEELQDRGWRGSRRTVQRYVQPFRATKTAPAATPAPPKVCHVARWIMTNPNNLDPDAQA